MVYKKALIAVIEVYVGLLDNGRLVIMYLNLYIYIYKMNDKTEPVK